MIWKRISQDQYANEHDDRITRRKHGRTTVKNGFQYTQGKYVYNGYINDGKGTRTPPCYSFEECKNIVESTRALQGERDDRDINGQRTNED